MQNPSKKYQNIWHVWWLNEAIVTLYLPGRKLFEGKK